MRCQSASARSSVGVLMRRPPTLFTRMSIAGNVLEHRAAELLGVSGFVMSA